MNMTPEQRRFLLVGNGVIAGVINVVINGAIAVVSYWSLSSLPIVGWTSVRADLTGMAYLLPAITVLINTPIVRRANLPAVTLPGWLRWFRRPLLVRSVMFGLAGLVVVALPVWLATTLVADGAAVSSRPYVVAKAMVGGLYGLLVTPLIAVVALSDQAATHDPPQPG